MFVATKILSAISPSSSPASPRRKTRGTMRKVFKRTDSSMSSTSSRRSSDQKQQDAIKLLLVATDSASKDFMYEEILSKTSKITDCYVKELATSGLEFSYFGQKFALIDAISSQLHKDISSEKSLLCCDDTSINAFVFVFSLANADNWSESLKLFKYFTKKMPSTPRIVTLTQMHCFAERLMSFRFSDMFPSYSGDNSAESCMEFIQSKVMFQSTSSVPAFIQVLDAEVCSLKQLCAAYRELTLKKVKDETGLAL